MSTKPENRFIGSIHKILPKNIYAEKMNNPWRSGTADVWYSGEGGDLWVEYKFIERIPKSLVIAPDLTPRQSRWLNDRFDEGRNVAVVLGTPTGGVIYRNKEWTRAMDNETLSGLVIPKIELARWITNQVGVQHVSRTRSRQRVEDRSS